MRHKLINHKTITLIIILGVSFGVYSTIYFTPQTSTYYPLTPFMSYYTKLSYSKNADGTASESSVAITIVWLSNIINASTVEISERDIEMELGIIPSNFTPIETYQVNLLTRDTNSPNGNFLYWVFPFMPNGMPIKIGNNIAIAISS